MNETPYEMLLRKSRQRKHHLLNNIQQQNFKHRSICYNLKLSNDFSQDPQNKSKENQKHKKQNRMNFNSCLKKSYYYRKFLNKTADGQLTHQEFNKLKETFNKIGVYHKQKQKNPAIFREIWETQIKRKYSIRLDEEKELQLMVKSNNGKKNSQDLPIISCTQQANKLEEVNRKVQEIAEIANQRKMSLDFELQIQGNKKYIKGKDTNKQHKLTSLVPAEDANKEEKKIMANCNNTLSQNQLKAEPTKPICNFFKRLKQATRNDYTQQKIKDATIKIKKIHPRQDIQERKMHVSNNLSPKMHRQLKSFDCAVEERDIRTGWNSSSESHNQRYYKVQNSEKCRISIKKQRKFIVGCSQINDIQGWNVKFENEYGADF